MGIDGLKTAISVGDGFLEWGMKKWDAKAVPPRTEAFKNAKDISNLVVALGGYALQAFTKRGRIGEAMALSATPKLVESILVAVEAQVAPAARNYVPRRAATPIPAGYTPMRGNPVEVGRTYNPEFEHAIAI